MEKVDSKGKDRINLISSVFVAKSLITIDQSVK